MKIRNVTLCNFKNFRGEQKIDLTPNTDAKQNTIIVIGGFNGSGKTTIVDSIKLCLFGRRFDGSILSWENYHKYLLLSKNKSSVKDNDNRFFIQIEIDIDDTYPIYSIILKREWTLNKGKVEENFTIYREDVPLEIIPRDYWEDYISSIIPLYTSDYFFFDGERVKELASGNKAEEILKDAIRDLIGLKLYETLATDLDFLINMIKRRNINRSELQEKIIEKEKEISMINKEINRIENDIAAKSHKVAKLYNIRKDVETDLRRRAGAFARERKKNENALLRLKKELDKLNNEIGQICGDVLPFVIASDVCEDLLNQLKKERRLKELVASKHILKEINQNLMRKVESSEKLTDLPKNQLISIKTEIDSIFSEMFEEVDNESQDFFIHDLTSAEMDFIENFLKKTEESVKSEFYKIIKRREKILLQTKKLRDKLKQVPDESFVKEYVEKLASIRTEIELLEKEINTLKNDSQLLKHKKVEIEGIGRKLGEKIVCIEEDARKIDVSMRIKDSIRDFIDIVISSKIGELERIITNMYRKLANKDDMVKDIKIDHKTFNTTLIDFDDDVVDKDNLSAGEKEIYALSVLWGLSKISNRKLPLIIDSPLAKLDKSHVDKITENFFPNAGDQVIILSHDREIGPELYGKLKPHINKAYTLSLSEINKINEGYFFE